MWTQDYFNIPLVTLIVWDLCTVLLWPIKQLRDLRGKSGLFRDHIWTLVPIATKSRNRDLFGSTAYHTIPCNAMEYHTTPYAIQYYSILCNTRQYHATKQTRREQNWALSHKFMAQTNNQSNERIEIRGHPHTTDMLTPFFLLLSSSLGQLIAVYICKGVSFIFFDLFSLFLPLIVWRQCSFCLCLSLLREFAVLFWFHKKEDFACWPLTIPLSASDKAWLTFDGNSFPSYIGIFLCITTLRWCQ